MSELFKIIIGFISGIAVGVLAEPMKRWIGTVYMTKRAEKAIYAELSGLYRRYCFEEKPGAGVSHFYLAPPFTSERFDYYYAEYRDALFDIPAWYGIKLIYDTFHRINAEIENHVITELQGKEQLKKQFMTCVECNMIEKHKLTTQ